MRGVAKLNICLQKLGKAQAQYYFCAKFLEENGISITQNHIHVHGMIYIKYDNT